MVPIQEMIKFLSQHFGGRYRLASDAERCWCAMFPRDPGHKHFVRLS